MLATSAPFSKWFASCLNPPATTLPLFPSLPLSPSLPFSINHQNLKLYVFEGEKEKEKQKQDRRKSYKMVLGSLYTLKRAPFIPQLAFPHLSMSWSWCSHMWPGRLPSSKTSMAHVKHLISRAGGLAGPFFSSSSSSRFE